MMEKRVLIALFAYPLEINNCGFVVPRFINQMQNYSVDVADNRIDKNLLH
jgi:death on curing protein